MKGFSKTFRCKIQMSSTETTWGERELYNDTESEGLLTIEYSVWNFVRWEYTAEEMDWNMCVYHAEFSWYRLYDLISQSETDEHASAKGQNFQDTGK